MKKHLDQNLAWLLILSSIPAKLAFGKVAEQYNLTYMQLLTLCLVESCKNGPVMHNITTTLGCDASNVTGFVDKLVSQELLERTESPLDRRTKIITLTGKGEQTRQAAMSTFAKSEFLNVLTPEETVELTRILCKLQARIS